MKTALKSLKKLPNGLLTQTLHAMDDYCDYLMDYRLYDLYDEDMLAIIFKGKSPLDLITLGLHAGQNQEFYLTDKYLAVNYDIDKVWTVSESNSDEYYKDVGDYAVVFSWCQSVHSNRFVVLITETLRSLLVDSSGAVRWAIPRPSA